MPEPLVDFGRTIARRAWICMVLLALGCSGSPYVAKHSSDWSEASLPDSPEIHRVYLVGDAGGIAPTDDNPVLASVLRSSALGPESATLVFLGDNVYCCGLPDSADTRRAEAQEKLDALIEVARDFRGRTFFIPGNHDWNDAGATGPSQVRRMGAYIEAALGEGVFVPSGGLPGPEIFELEDDIVLIAIDTEWWLTRGDRPYGDSGEYEIDEDLDFVVALNDALDRYSGERVLLVGHHPVYSQGPHNGRLPAKTHLFPLTRINENAYLPLPILGSLYALGSRMFGGRQDLPNPRYRRLRSLIAQAGRRNDSVIYASGHEHSLQYFAVGPDHRPRHNIISGSASRPSYVAGGGGATFTSSSLGYSSVSYFGDGAMWASFWAVDESGGEHLLFRKELQPGRELALPTEITEPVPDYRDSTVTMAINPGYLAGPIKSAILGSHNRALWATEIEVPVLDMGREAGGLTPVKRGGGMQTISLRLEGGDGHGYVLRSLDKDPAGSVPANLRGTVATDIVQDQISSIDPFGAYMIPPLAKAVGVLHTEPQLVYVPDDPRLGPYRELFADRLMMFEHRPDDDVSPYDNYGNSKKVVSDAKLYEELREDNDNRVDAVAFLRTRLFDMLLSDWDRHRGQWRWARFENEDGPGDTYLPIPRDRDWAFNRMNGLISVLAPFFDPKFQSFNPKFGDMKGLSTNGLEQDRRLLAGLDRSQWIAQAEHIRDAITPEVIEEAILRLPPEIREQDGDRIRRNLASRATELVTAAGKYYDAISRVVDIVGSDKHELFEVVRRPDGNVDIRMYKTNKDGDRRKLLLERTFLLSETKQIRLFGLGGQDRFVVSGESRVSIEIVAVGGSGKDTISDSSAVAGFRKLTVFVDSDRGTEISSGGETKVRITDDPVINTYNSREFKYDVTLPQLFVSRNKDDGFFLGGGVVVTRHGFQRTPFATQQRFVANIAAKTQAFNIKYAGTWTNAVGPWALSISADILTPNNIRNFYGLGNETDNTVEDRTFYQARLSRVAFAPVLARAINDILTIDFGPYFQFTDVREEPDRFLAQQPGISSTTFDNQWFAGVTGTVKLEAVDHPANPRQGFRWSTTGTLRYGLSGTSDTFARYVSDFVLYVSPSLSPQVTLALRAGGQHNQGDFPFFEASALGGTTNLRGYRSTRYAGRTAAYQNSELRFKLFDVSSHIARGAFGLLGFADFGRVWTDAESSDTWHSGFGGGAWINIFGEVVASASYGISDDDEAFAFKLGFQY